MPSTRPTPKTMSGAKRPLNNRSRGNPRTTVSIQEGDYRGTATFASKPSKSSSEQVQYTSNRKGTPKQSRSVQKKLGSYAANYFKKNSK